MRVRRISQAAVVNVQQAGNLRIEQGVTHAETYGAERQGDMLDATQRHSPPDTHASLAREIVNPISGERIVVQTSGDQTGGQLLAFDLYLPPGGHVPAAHRHPAQEERFTIVTGQMRFRLGRRILVAYPGETVTVPIGTPHWFGNPGSDVTHAYVEVRPALRMEELFEVTEALGQRASAPCAPLNPQISLNSLNPLRLLRLLNPMNLVNSVRWLANLALVALKFQQEVAAPYVPAPLARAALFLLALPAWLTRGRISQVVHRPQPATSAPAQPHSGTSMPTSTPPGWQS